MTLLNGCLCKNKFLVLVQEYSPITRASQAGMKRLSCPCGFAARAGKLFFPFCLPLWWENIPALGQEFYSCTRNRSRKYHSQLRCTAAAEAKPFWYWSACVPWESIKILEILLLTWREWGYTVVKGDFYNPSLSDQWPLSFKVSNLCLDWK